MNECDLERTEGCLTQVNGGKTTLITLYADPQPKAMYVQLGVQCACYVPALCCCLTGRVMEYYGKCMFLQVCMLMDRVPLLHMCIMTSSLQPQARLLLAMLAARHRYLAVSSRHFDQTEICQQSLDRLPRNSVHIHGPERMNHKDFGDLPDFSFSAICRPKLSLILCNISQNVPDGWH